MPIFCCPWAAELKVWITNIELLIRCERIPFVESCQAICPQGYSLQCVTLFFLFTTNSDWWLETVVLCAPVFSVLWTQAEVDSIQVALLEDDGSEGHLTLLAARTIYLKVYIINVLLAKAAAVPVLWPLRRTETRIWRWEGRCLAFPSHLETVETHSYHMWSSMIHQRQATLSASPGGKGLHGAPWRSLLWLRWESALDRRNWPCHRIRGLVGQWATGSRTGRIIMNINEWEWLRADAHALAGNFEASAAIIGASLPQDVDLLGAKWASKGLLVDMESGAALHRCVVQFSGFYHLLVVTCFSPATLTPSQGFMSSRLQPFIS